MPTFTPVYTPAQRESVPYAYADKGIRPMARVLQLAAAGELETPTGERVEPFVMPIATARALCAEERRRRRGRAQSALASAPAHTQAEQVRARLLAIADAELLAVERQLAQKRKPDLARASAAAKVAREALALNKASVTAGGSAPAREERAPAAATPALQRLAAERSMGAHASTPERTGQDKPWGLAVCHVLGRGQDTARPGSHAPAAGAELAALGVRVDPVSTDPPSAST